MTSLPFPGYSWYFTQHAIGMRPKTLYGLLACASLAQGRTEPGPIVNRLIVDNGLLTENIRDGQVDAWRDYQQILAELGLIYSTRVHRALKLTPAGEMFLAGDVGFSELMTIQALRYQYPNGQKFTIQARLRAELEAASVSVPSNLIELMYRNDIAIKPGLLILRILLEMKNEIGVACLSVDECGCFLVPAQKNLEWRSSFDAIMRSRTSGEPPRLNNRNIRRNVQDWFKFLDKTDLFKHTLNCIDLIREFLAEFCNMGEDEGNFWYPQDFDPIDKESWFSYFGEMPFDAQLMMPSEQITEEYKESNYIGGFEVDETEEQLFGLTETPEIRLSEIALSSEEVELETCGDEDGPEISIAGIVNGIIQRKAKTILHDSIVKELASFFTTQGARVCEDRDSVDLLVSWSEGFEGIFEVKTVNRRSLQQRLRLAVGQLEEYAYRRNCSIRRYPEKIVVINSILPQGSWQVPFLVEHLNIGLLCRGKEEYLAHVPERCQTGEMWRNVVLSRS